MLKRVLSNIMVISTPHLQTLVDCNNWRLIVDRCDIDVNNAGQTVLPDFRLIGHDGKAVCVSVAAVMDVGDVLTFHLETEMKQRRFRWRLIPKTQNNVCAQSNLSVSEGSDGHPWDPAVLQVPISWRNDDLVQEVHL